MREAGDVRQAVHDPEDVSPEESDHRDRAVEVALKLKIDPLLLYEASHKLVSALHLRVIVAPL